MATVQREEFEALKTELAEDRRLREETHGKVLALYDALMVPAPGQQHSLLHRMASVTISAETGQAVGNRLIRMSKIVSAIGVVFGGAVALLKLGQEVPK